MGQVEPVPLRYQRKPRKRPRRTTNRERFELLFFGIFTPISALTFLPRVSGAWQLLVYIPFAILTVAAAVQFSNFLRRYRLAASRWMARPGERRILSHQTRLRGLGIRVLRRIKRLEVRIQSVGDVHPGGKSADHNAPKQALKTDPANGSISRSSIPRTNRRHRDSETSPGPKKLRVLIAAICLSAYCILFFKFLLPEPSQYPVSFAFGMIWGVIMALGLVSLAIELVVGTVRELRARKASTTKGLLAQWIDNWQPRIESFEMPPNDTNV